MRARYQNDCMSHLPARINFGVAGVLSAVIFAALMYVGLSEGKPGPFKAFVAAIVFIGYVVYQATQGHLSPQKDTALAGVVCLIGFETIT